MPVVKFFVCLDLKQVSADSEIASFRTETNEGTDFFSLGKSDSAEFNLSSGILVRGGKKGRYGTIDR